jgi:hypothetical protein
MKTVTIALLFLIIYLYFHLDDRKKSVPKIYMNIDLKDICGRVDRAPDAAGTSSRTNGETSLRASPEANEGTSSKTSLKNDASEANDIDNLYHDRSNFPLCGDDALTYRMYDMGQKNKHAMTNRAMWNKNNLIPYLEEELRSHSNSIWWDDETLEGEF